MTSTPANHRVAVLLFLTDDYGRRIFIGAEDFAAGVPDLDITPVAVKPAEQRNEEYSQLRRFDGVIAALPHTQVAFRRERLAIPIVETPRHHSPCSDPMIAPDSRRIGEVGAEHLLSLRLKNLGIFRTDSQEDLSELERGFRDACAQAGVEPLPFTYQRITCGAEDMAALLLEQPLPLGVLCNRDSKGANLIKAAAARGLRVPEDVAVCGIGNDPFACASVIPRVSSVQTHPERVGRHAAQAIRRILRGEPFDPVRIPPGEVVARESTNTVAIDDDAAAEAVRFIRRQGGKLVSVQTVARHVGLSRRALEKHFRKSLGSGIHEEVIRVRLERAGSLLTHTDMPIKRIALALGMRTPYNLSKLMKQHTGLSPKQYRAKHRSSPAYPKRVG